MVFIYNINTRTLDIMSSKWHIVIAWHKYCRFLTYCHPLTTNIVISWHNVITWHIETRADKSNTSAQRCTHEVHEGFKPTIFRFVRGGLPLDSRQPGLSVKRWHLVSWKIDNVERIASAYPSTLINLDIIVIFYIFLKRYLWIKHRTDIPQGALLWPMLTGL